MQALPLFYYPGSWLWVDDDPVLLSCMTLAFNEINSVKPFLSSSACLDFLNTYKSPLLQQHFLTSQKQDEKYGVLQHTPIDFDVTSLANLASDKNRQQELTVMVMDYNMPEIDGLALARITQSLPIQKILLTGKAQEHDAITAFNNNLIHRFVKKGEANTEEKLTLYLQELSKQYFQKITAPLLAYLETENKLPLSDPIFINFFEEYCQQQQIKEYYLIDKQGSFLCIDHEDKRSCLVLMSEQGMTAWLNTYQKEKYATADEIMQVSARKKIPFFGIGKEGWQVDTSEWSTHFHESNILEGRARYYWARVEVN